MSPASTHKTLIPVKTGPSSSWLEYLNSTQKVQDSNLSWVGYMADLHVQIYTYNSTISKPNKILGEYHHLLLNCTLLTPPTECLMKPGGKVSAFRLTFSKDNSIASYRALSASASKESFSCLRTSHK